MKILNSLVDAGNTVVVIEHNLDVIKTADWVIDLGPHAGNEGGWIVAEGTPEDIVQPVSGRESSARRRRRPDVKPIPGVAIGGLHPASFQSLTALALVDVLNSGTYGDRESVDPATVRHRQDGDLCTSQVSNNSQRP